MTTDQLMNITPISVEAGSDLSASQFCAVTVNSSGQLVLPAANASILGILYDVPAAQGRAGAVQCAGVVKWRLGGTVAKGDKVKTDSTGRAVTASAADVAAGYGCGVCITGGAVNNNGEIFVEPNLGIVAVSGVQALTDSGTINNTTLVTTLAITGTDAYGMSDGLYVTQRKIVRCISAASSPAGTVTPTTVSTDTAGGTSPASVVFNAAGQEVEYEWDATGWKIMRVRAAGADAPAAASTLNLLVANHVITIANTQDWIIPSGYVPGQKQMIMVATTSGSPVGTISGLFYDEDGSADGVDVNLNAQADFAYLDWDGVRWMPVQLVSSTVS